MGNGNDTKLKVHDEADCSIMMRIDDKAESEYDVGLNMPFFHIKTDDGNQVVITISLMMKLGEKAQEFHKQHFVPRQKH